MAKITMTMMALLVSITAYEIDPDCDFTLYVSPGYPRIFYNPDFPKYYPRNQTCRWVGISDPGTKILLKCDLAVKRDMFLVSLTGDPQFSDAKDYNQQQRILLKSAENSIAVGLIGITKAGGRLACDMTAA